MAFPSAEDVPLMILMVVLSQTIILVSINLSVPAHPMHCVDTVDRERNCSRDVVIAGSVSCILQIRSELFDHSSMSHDLFCNL